MGRFPAAALAQFGKAIYVAKPASGTFCLSNRAARLTAAVDRAATQTKLDLGPRAKDILRHVSSEDHFLVMNKMPGTSERFGMGFSLNGALTAKVVVGFAKSQEAERKEEQFNESLAEAKKQLGSKRSIPFMPAGIQETAKKVIDSLSLDRSGNKLIVTAGIDNEDIRKLVTAMKAALPGMLQQAMGGGMRGRRNSRPQGKWRR